MPGFASGAIVFSGVTVGGPLGAGTTFVAGDSDIDFTFPFPTATAGDPVDPIRGGLMTVQFDVTGTAGEIFAQDTIAILGGFAGSGAASIDITVTDLVVPGTIFQTNFVLSESNPPPAAVQAMFSRGSSSIRVLTTMNFSAPDTADLDLANVSFMEHRFIPSPGALGLLGIGALTMFRRRK